jgi:hypothetical protein
MNQNTIHSESDLQKGIIMYSLCILGTTIYYVPLEFCNEIDLLSLQHITLQCFFLVQHNSSIRFGEQHINRLHAYVCQSFADRGQFQQSRRQSANVAPLILFLKSNHVVAM